VTLLVNQLHIDLHQGNHFWIAAADQLLTTKKGFHAIKTKIFAVKRLNCSISYFGLASFRRSSNSKEFFIGNIIESFISKDSTSQTIGQFAANIRNYLITAIPAAVLSQSHSGFHICGFESNGLPVLYHFSNITGMNGIYYGPPSQTYNNLTEDFAGRDAAQFGFNPTNMTFTRGGIQEYRNGDLSIHVHLARDLLSTMSSIQQYSNYISLSGPYQFASLIELLYKIISNIQKRWAKTQLIGGKSTIMIIKKTGVELKRHGKWHGI